MRNLFCALAIVFSASCTADNIENRDMKIIAHRGGALLGNENTISAFSKGMEAGADMIELDVHLTSDRKVVICHDQTVDRTTDGTGRIENMTLSQFKSLHALDRETGEITGETLPTLAEALELMRGRADILLEIKKTRRSQYEGIEQIVLDEIESKGMLDNVTIQSFNDSVLEKVHSLNPHIRVEKLLFCRVLHWICIDNGLNVFSFRKYDYCASFNSMRSLTSRRFIRDCHKAGKEVKIWTVNSPDGVIAGSDGVITNRPDLFRDK